jgi:predicted amidohydrolase
MGDTATASTGLKVAAAQYPLDALGSFDEWAQKVSHWVGEGARTDAALLVFPEYGALEIAPAAGGHVTANLAATLAAVADMEAQAGSVWQALARRLSVHILAPSGPERRDAGFVNAARLYTPSGCVGVQDKLILTPFERDWGMVPGQGQRVFETAIGRIGIAICYDSEFPLLVRALTEAGAEIVLVPSCTEHVSGFHRVRNAALARALESQVATVMAATAGLAPWSAVVDRNRGAAGIFVPPDVAQSMNGIVAEGVLDAPGWVSGEIDLGGLAHLRQSGEMRNWADWSRQRGAAPLGDGVDVVRLG